MREELGIRRRHLLGLALVSAVLVAACAAVPDVDLPLEAPPLGRPSASNPKVSALPPATGPAKPSPGCSTPTKGTVPTGPFDGPRKLPVKGQQQREFLLHVPSGVATPGQPAPLVLDMHGLGTTAALQAGLSAWNTLADREGVVVAHPQGANNAWNIALDDANPDIPFLRAVATTVQAERCIDLTRTYATGLSMGGLVSAALACKASDVFAAFGLVSGIQWKPECNGAPARSVVVFWGSQDCVLPYFGSYGPCLTLGPPHTQPSAPVPYEQQSGFPPVDEVIEAWATHNGCRPGGDSQPASASVTFRRYVQCRPGGEVEFYFVDGGGHTWPGSRLLQQAEAANPSLVTATTTLDIDATELIWTFFRAHQLS